MSEWKETRLKEFISVSSGEGLPDSKMKPGQYPVYGGNGITGNHNEFLFSESRLIIGRVGALCGNVHITQKKSWITDNALVVSFLNNNQDVYFWYYMLSNLKLREYAFQSAQPVITGGIIDQIKLKIPVLISEQNHIARILTTCDTIIKQSESAIAKYKALKQGLLHDLFTRGLDANGHLRPNYQDAPESFKESKLGMIPKEWEVKKLKEIFSVSSGYALTQNKIEPGTYPVYGGNGINGYHNQYLFENEKLIIGRVGEYCGNAFITTSKSWVTDNALIVSFFKNNSNLQFWYYYLNFINLNSLAYAAAQPVITGNLLSKVNAIIIDNDEQKEIVKRLSTFDIKLHSEETLLQKYQSIKKGLMGDLLECRDAMHGVSTVNDIPNMHDVPYTNNIADIDQRTKKNDRTNE